MNSADGRAVNCPSSSWQKSHLTLGSATIRFLSPEDEKEANIHEMATFGIPGAYLESGFSKGGF